MSTQFGPYTGEGKEIVYLVDGSSYVYRAYYAIRELFNSKGQPTNAIFGFVRMLMKLLNDRAPKYLAMFFDVRGTTFRHDKYKKYKATRPPMPENLVQQLPWIKRIVVGFGLPIFEMAGFEADDLIGTTARIVQKSGLAVVVVSGDKDMMQLVTDNCIILDPSKDAIIDLGSIQTKFGIRPEQIVDVLGFSGDRADNIPGVPGIGLKTALKLVTEFGSMEDCYQCISHITKKKQKDNLLKFKEQAFLSRDLVTINVNSPVDVETEKLLVLKPDKKFLRDLFKELEFKKLKKQFTEKLRKRQKNYIAIDSEVKLDRLVLDLNRCSRFALDTETDSIDPMVANFVGISVSMKEDEAFYIPVGHDYPGVTEQLPLKLVLNSLKPILANPGIEKIGQNIRYDSVIFLRHGVSVVGIKFDTMLASYLIDPSKKTHNLDRIAMDFLDHRSISYEEVVGKGKDKVSFDRVPIEEAVIYACEDADITLAASNIFIPILKQTGLMDLMRNVEIPLIPVLIRMEMNGVRVDETTLQKLSISLRDQLLSLEEEIYKETGVFFNINSSQQLAHVMFEQLKLPVQKMTKSKKGYSTDVKVLTKLASCHSVPRLVLRYRTLSKLRSTYVDAMLDLINVNTHRIHTSFNQTVTATGRLSSSNPNLQNIPIRTEAGREIRKAFVPAKDCYLLSADYSQIELRILAHYSKDEVLIDSFRRDEDIHIRTASEIFQISSENIDDKLRRQAKLVNFGIIYGMSAYRLADELNISNKTAKMYIDSYFERYKGVKKFISETISTAFRTKQTKTLLGRIRYLRDICSKNQTLRKMAERTALNTVIQGTAADLIKLAMINVDSVLAKPEFKTEMLLSVHDELILEVPYEEMTEVKSIIRSTMESVFDLAVPLKVNMSFGKNWAEAH